MSEYKRGGFDPGDSRSALPELEGVFERPPYAPTPLNPYDLKKDGVPYIQSAQEIIDELFRHNLMALETRPPDTMIDLLRVSISSALFRRFDNNGGKTIPADCDDETAELFARACLGQATPSDLIELLSRRPEDIESVELAKQTHPFSWGATNDMDIAIDTMLDQGGFAKRGGERTQNARYYYIRADDNQNPAAIIIVRKADLGVRPCGNGGDLVVVERDSFVLDLTHDDTRQISREVRLWLQSEEGERRLKGNRKAPYTAPLMTEFVGAQLTTRSDLRSPALYPGVRSYYAFCETPSRGDPDDLTED